MPSRSGKQQWRGWRSGGDGHVLLGADAVGDEAEIPVRGDEGKDPLGLPALEANAGVEADVVQQPRVLQGVTDWSVKFHQYQQFEQLLNSTQFLFLRL